MLNKPVSLLSILSVLFGCILIIGCATNDKIALKPATVLSRDVFTCKGLSPNNHWVGVTDHFNPEFDPRVVLVANFAPADMNTRIHYEFVNPMESIVIVESIDRPENNPLGIYVEMSRLLELGGEGEWTANVYSNTRPIGQAIFTIGEEKEEDEDLIEGYYVVGEESLEEEDEPDYESQPYDAFIQEVTPELDIPEGQEALDYLQDLEGAPSYTEEEIEQKDISGEIEEAEAVGDVLPQRSTNVQEEEPVSPNQ